LLQEYERCRLYSADKKLVPELGKINANGRFDIVQSIDYRLFHLFSKELDLFTALTGKSQ